MQNSHWIAWKTAAKASNMPSQDVWNFTPVSYRTSALWGRCPALTPLLQLITPSRASGTADHVRSLDDLFNIKSVSGKSCACLTWQRSNSWMSCPNFLCITNPKTWNTTSTSRLIAHFQRNGSGNSSSAFITCLPSSLCSIYSSRSWPPFSKEVGLGASHSKSWEYPFSLLS